MKAIKKPIKVDCWLITQEELNSIWLKKTEKDCFISAFGGKLHGSECWFYHERKDYFKKKGFGNVIAKIQTFEGEMIIRAGDYLIKERQKGFYLCKADIFKKTYSFI